MNYFGGALAVELTPVKGAEPEGEHNTRRRAKPASECRLNSRSTLQDKQHTGTFAEVRAQVSVLASTQYN